MAGRMIRRNLLLCLIQSCLAASGNGDIAFDVFKEFKGTWTIQAGEKTLPFKMTYDAGSKDSIVTELFGKENTL